MHTIKDQKEKGNKLTEVSDVEKHLWACVLSKGLLDSSVQNLYHKACKLYEKIFLSDNELEELQEIEFSLWKLHYKHIDEFRKRTSQFLDKEEPAHFKRTIEGFELFLRDSSEFYQHLVDRIKSYYGFSETTLFYNNLGVSGSLEQEKLHKCRFVCHRLLICLGDLLRYLEFEVYEKLGNRQRHWFSSAKWYLEAAKMYPDGGNPQNQLALLSIYVGDQFLALYHFLRSLAVKEPFPDAFNNLILLFERNRSAHIDSLSVCAKFDFKNPLQRVGVLDTISSSNRSSDCGTLIADEKGCSLDSDIWPLIVRLTSLFFFKFSLESFSYTFASTVSAVEALLALDDSKLNTSLESYESMNLSRSGPYRALQLVCILIFIIQNTSENPEQQPLKFSIMFIFMGRVVERCLKSTLLEFSPLLPAVLVFSEWLVAGLKNLENFGADENLRSALYYFFSSFAELLNQLLGHKDHAESSEDQNVALWEDYEMRGFKPISQCHSAIDFSTCSGSEANFKLKNERRAHRIIQAAMEITNRPCSNAQMWIFQDTEGKFSLKETNECSERKKSEEKTMKKLISVEEEEDIIVFKPITRYNSAPISSYLPENAVGDREGSMDMSILSPKSSSSSDESLRRASSLLIAQNRALIDSLTSRPAPPSLSSWVLNGERLSSSFPSSSSSSSTENIGNGREHGREFLKPINEETISDNLSRMTFEKDGFGFCSTEECASTSPETMCNASQNPPYCAPPPSAPLLPEDAVWFSSGVSGHNYVPSFVSHPPLLLRPLITSSPAPPLPWALIHPKENQIHQSSNLSPGVQQGHLYLPASYNLYSDSSLNSFPGCSNNNSFYIQQASRFDILDGWSGGYYPLGPPPVIYSESTPPLIESNLSPHAHGFIDQRRDMLLNHHRDIDGGNSYVRAEQQKLLQYLKEKEWRIQQESARVAASTYTRI